jgi:hypothetical protein
MRFKYLSKFWMPVAGLVALSCVCASRTPPANTQALDRMRLR